MRTVLVMGMLCGLTVISGTAEDAKNNEPNKIAREISARTADLILPQVDFAKEHLLRFQWSGSGKDQLAFSIEEEGPVVVFTHTPGLTRDLRPHTRLYAVQNNATRRIDGKPGRLKDPVKITSAEELAKHLPAAKEK